MSVSGTTAFGIELTGSPVLAKKEAVPIDIYYWTDYQCRFCKQFETKYVPELVRNEVIDGIARIVILQYPRYGNHSVTAAVMAKCIWRTANDRTPDMFWQWHHTMFEHQGLVGTEWSSRESLLEYARSTGINARAIDQCIRQDRPAREADVLQERKRAQEEGFSQTPAFVVYRPETNQHIKFRGAQPHFVFQRHIKTLLNQ